MLRRRNRAMANMPVWGDVREYTWFIRDGFFVRSPTKFNGVTIDDADCAEVSFPGFYDTLAALAGGRRP